MNIDDLLKNEDPNAGWVKRMRARYEASQPPIPSSNPARLPDWITSPDFSKMTNKELNDYAVKHLRQNLLAVVTSVGTFEYLDDLRKTQPKAFCQLLNRLLPQTIEQNVTVEQKVPDWLSSITNEQARKMLDNSLMNRGFVEVINETEEKENDL